MPEWRNLLKQPWKLQLQVSKRLDWRTLRQRYVHGSYHFDIVHATVQHEQC